MTGWLRRWVRPMPPPADEGNGHAAQEARERAQKRLDDTIAGQPRVEAVVRRLRSTDHFAADIDRSFRARGAT